jgi:selenocysteine-specific elongation factor
MNELVAVSDEVVFRRRDYEIMLLGIQDLLKEKKQVSLAEVRDLFQTSRKFIQPLLEHLDSSGVTIREGDFRRLRA